MSMSPWMSIAIAPKNLSSSMVLSGNTHFSLLHKVSHLSLNTTVKTTTIRMGGGPRTYPGGVSKWQWKRMQAKKAKQLLKAKLARERQIYEMRKRAELKAAVSELERPWEVVEKAPNLFSASADEQVKVLADRFQRPGGFDLWSERDGPQLFETRDGVPSARFFPKGVVHSIKPYERIGVNLDNFDEFGYLDSNLDDGRREKMQVPSNDYEKNMCTLQIGSAVDDMGPESSNNLLNEEVSGKGPSKGKRWKTGSGRRIQLAHATNSNNGFNRSLKMQANKDGHFTKGKSSSQKLKDLNSEVCDMSLQHDGSYGVQTGNLEFE